MGTIVLIIAFVVEAAFAAYRIYTKSNRRQLRSYIRIGAFGIFALLALVSVIQWSFRWVLLAVLLLVWAALGALGVIRKRAEKRAFSAGRTVVAAVGGLLLVFIAVTPALVFPQYTAPAVTGSHPVATASFTYTDPNRIETFTTTGEHREVNVEFWYPKDGGGPYPLVVFDHGMMGMKASNASTFVDLASNGYVVCSIDHPYLSLFTVDDKGHRVMMNRAYLQEYMAVSQGKYDEETSGRLEQKWVGWRVDDIEFVLDTILANARDAGSGPVYGMIDPTEIGLIGHSLGGESSAEVGRERSDIGAVVNLDADLADEYVDYVDGKWTLNQTLYPVPILNIFSDALMRLMDAVPDSTDTVAVLHLIATDPNAYEVHLQGTDHMSFTDLPLVSPLLVRLLNASVPQAGGQEVNPLATIETMNDTVLRFYNASLKGEGSFN